RVRPKDFKCKSASAHTNCTRHAAARTATTSRTGFRPKKKYCKKSHSQPPPEPTYPPNLAAYPIPTRPRTTSGPFPGGPTSRSERLLGREKTARRTNRKSKLPQNHIVKMDRLSDSWWEQDFRIFLERFYLF